MRYVWEEAHGESEEGPSLNNNDLTESGLIVDDGESNRRRRNRKSSSANEIVSSFTGCPGGCIRFN